jgi:hypothetical protein
LDGCANFVVRFRLAAAAYKAISHIAPGTSIARGLKMIRQAIFVIVAGLSCRGPVHAQSICNDSEIVFVGRAEAAVTYHISGEAEIEKARQNVVQIEEELARLPKPLDEPTRLEQATEIAIRLIKAQHELGRRKAMYPPPQNVTLIPLSVVRPLRGVSEHTLMVYARPELPSLQPGEEYLIYGMRSKRFIPHFPEMGDLVSLADYVEADYIFPAASAQQRLQFLAATSAGATVMGSLKMHSLGGLPPALAGVRVRVSSGGQGVEATTREDGGFVASGLPAGELEIKPALSSDLTVVNQYPRKVVVRAGGCATVELRAAVNGRVRGRIFTAPDVSLDTVKLALRVMHVNRRTFGSHDAVFGTSARADGTFEFSGVSPGTYLLSASVQENSGGATGIGVTYYPGTDDVDAATPVVVGKATEHDGFDFVVRTQ